jgi:hypothetical protein
MFLWTFLSSRSLNRTRRIRALLWLSLLPGLLGIFGSTAFAGESPAPEFRLIVHPRNPASQVSREFVTDAFLKKKTRWADDETLKPVDLKADSAVRRKFSQSILKRSVAAVRSYWQQRIFSGRGVPPPELESDDAVVAYVLKHRGAVGYVSPNAKLGEAKPIGVK